MSFIEVQQLKYRYPHTEKLALDGLDFQIEKGEFIGIVGENKSGKSTLCQAFAGLVPTMFKGAYGGKILLFGMEAAKTPIAKLCQRVGLVFQNPFNQLSGAKDSVFEEVAFGLQNLGIPREMILERVEDALERLDIGEYRNRNPFDLSGGQIQRVALASILAMRPEVLVLDEPTSQLDPKGSEEVFGVVEKLAQTGITIIMVEHKMEKLAAYCDKILLLHGGRQVAFDRPEKIFSREDLGDFGIRPPVHTQICRAMQVRTKEGLYPVTLEQALACKSQFPVVFPEMSESVPAVVPLSVLPLAETGSPLVELRDLAFYYRKESPVIDWVSLWLDGRPTAIIGQNGAGKTTIVKLIKGLLKPVSGSVYYAGEDIASKTVAMLADRVGYVFQNPDDQIFKNKVLDEVMVGPLHMGMDREAAQCRAMEALRMVELEDFSKENPYDLELAERKMVAIASVLAMDTQVIILDEPTIAQDEKGRSLIGRLVRELSGRGKLVLAILHDMDFVAEYFNRVIVMWEGRVLADGSREEVFYQEDILKAAGLEQPHVAALCRRLGYGGVHLTLEHFSNTL